MTEQKEAAARAREALYAWTSQFAEAKLWYTKRAYSQGNGWRMAVILMDL